MYLCAMNCNIKNTFWALLAVVILTTFPFLGMYDFHTKGEPREAVVAHSILESGNWILPTNNGGEIPYKPPFFHWCIAAVSMPLGEVTEASSRMPSAIAMTCLVMGAFVFYAKRKSLKVALAAGVMLLLSMEMHRSASNCRVDMMLAAFSWGAMALMFRWWEKGMKGIPWAAVLMMTLGTLTKGPVGSIVPCVAMGGFLLLKKEPFYKAFLRMLFLGILSLIIPALWYYAAYLQGGKEFLDLAYEENIGRMTHTMDYEPHVHPWFYPIFFVLFGMLPFTLVPIFALWSREGKKVSLHGGIKSLWARLTVWIQGLDDVTLFSMASAVLILVFYCIPSSKRAVYIMPMYPFLCYFTSSLMFWLSDKGKRSLSVFTDVVSVLILVITGLWMILSLCSRWLTYDFLHQFMGSSEVTSVLALTGVTKWWHILIILTMAFFAIWWWVEKKKNRKDGALWYSLFLVLIAYVSIDGCFKPAALNAKSVKDVAARIDKVCPESTCTLYEYIEDAEMALGDPIHYFELNFYLGDRIRNFKKEAPKEGFLMIGDKDFELRKPVFEAGGYRFDSPVYISDKKIIKQIMSVYPFRRD